MSRTFVTGATGYLGGYVCTRLLDRDPSTQLAVMVRGTSTEHAIAKLWKSWQLHMDAPAFYEAMNRVEVHLGDLHAPNLGLSEAEQTSIAASTESVLHIAASLNRKSERACLNTNLRGLLSMLTLARKMQDAHGLRRFSFVSTAAVAGERHRELVPEDRAVEWDRRQYDPYARTKALGEHMVRELLPDVPITIFRPSTVLGDSRHSRTTQWDMVRAFVFFAELPVLPWGPDIRQDIVNADYVGDAIAHIHTCDAPKWDTYHLSAGAGSRSTKDLLDAMVAGTGRRGPRLSRRLGTPFSRLISAAEQVGPNKQTQRMAALLRVFLPYVTNDTVFDNSRVVAEMGRGPVPFTEYASSLYGYAKDQKFRYPYLELPPR
ncbi:MAG: SDR family oxidoreductase [Myxococcota bacterium]